MKIKNKMQAWLDLNEEYADTRLEGIIFWLQDFR